MPITPRPKRAATAANAADPPPTLDAIFRDTIRAWMRRTGTSQEALGQRIGKTQAWVSRYLSGEIDVNLDGAVRIAGAFNQDLAALLALTAKKDELALLEGYRALPPRD